MADTREAAIKRLAMACGQTGSNYITTVEAPNALRALLTERDAARAEVARLTAALADAERRGAAKYRARVINAVTMGMPVDNRYVRMSDMLDAITALSLPEPPREEG